VQQRCGVRLGEVPGADAVEKGDAQLRELHRVARDARADSLKDLFKAWSRELVGRWQWGSSRPIRR
jgi:hypothetical protein